MRGEEIKQYEGNTSDEEVSPHAWRRDVVFMRKFALFVLENYEFLLCNFSIFFAKIL